MMISHIKTLILIFLFSSGYQLYSQELLITEFMASNNGIVTDNFGDSSDWIEILNASESPIDLQNYYISDNKKEKRKFQLSELLLLPSNYCVIWASGEKHTFEQLPQSLEIKFKSAGLADGNYSIITVNGEEKSLNQRGLNLVVLSSNGEYLQSLNFDTYISVAQSDSLLLYLQSLANGQIVVFAAKDDASSSLTNEVRKVIAAFGSKKIFNLGYRDSWGMISIKGKGAVSESYKKMGHGEASSEISNIHADFKLDREGEYIGIYDSKGNVIDSITFSTQFTDRSYGRLSLTSNEWAFFTEPSPGSANINSFARFGKALSPMILPAESYSTKPLSVQIISTDSICKTYYTVDGSIPDSDSYLYDKPLLISRSTVIRACCVKEGYFDSDISTQTYIIKPYKTLPIVSLVTSPDNLWDPVYGIYTEGNDPAQPNYSNRGERWERPGSYSWIDINSTNTVSSDCGIRIHGGVGRYIPKKSFRLYFKAPIVYHPPFSEFQPAYQQDVIVLSSGTNDSVADPRAMGRVWTLTRNHLMMRLYEMLGYPRVNKYPVILYLNGEYWGIYFVTERINQQFLKNHLNIQSADLIKDNAVAEEGTLDHWQETVNFFSTADLVTPENFEKALELINLENFTDYFILNLFGANWDWPTHNTYCYRDNISHSKWNWLIWDADCSFLSSPNHNTLHETLFTEKGNEIFYHLIRNEQYRHYFCNRTSYLLNSKLTPGRICAVIDSLAWIIEPEIDYETERWGGSKEQWSDNINRIKKFAIERPEHFHNMMNSELNLGGLTCVKILNQEISQGVVMINGYQIETFPFSGLFYASLPIQFEVQTKEGYIFKTWGNDQFSTRFSINLQKGDTLNLCLEFVGIQAFQETKGTFEAIVYYPNPFNTELNIRLFSIADTQIELTMYNITGQTVATMKQNVNSGFNLLTWKANDNLGYRLPNGVYLCSISDSKQNVISKITLMR